MKSCYLPHCRLLPSFISILQGSLVVFDYWFRWRSVLPLQSALHLKHLHIWRMLSNGIQYVTSYVMTNIEVVTIAIQSLCSLICSVICVYEMCVSYALSTCLQRFSCFSPWSEDIGVTVQDSNLTSHNLPTRRKVLLVRLHLSPVQYLPILYCHIGKLLYK